MAYVSADEIWQEEKAYQAFLKKYDVKSPDDPRHNYDYRMAFHKGVTPTKWSKLPVSNRLVDLLQVGLGYRKPFNPSGYFWPDRDHFTGTPLKGPEHEIPLQISSQPTAQSLAQRAVVAGGPERVLDSRREAILGLVRQGIVDEDELFNLLNFSAGGEEIGNISREEIQGAMPSREKIPNNLLLAAQNLTGLKSKNPISMFRIDMGESQSGFPQHTGRFHKNSFVINSRYTGQGIGTPESNIIHETIHALLEQYGMTNIPEKELEEAVRDSEYWYLAGGSGPSPKMQKLLHKYRK